MMHGMRNILFATDFSDSARHALRYALALAKREGGALHFLHVMEPERNTAPGIERPDAPANAVDQVRAALDELAEQANGLGVSVECHVRHGKPWREIVDEAQESGVDLVLIASHGHGGFEHVVFGGTCERVVRLSRVPVLTIKDPEHEFVQEGSTKVHLQRVLCPYDFSDYSKLALPAAAVLCRSFDATLVLAHVMYPYLEFPNFSGENMSPPLIMPAHPAREALTKVAAGIEGVRTEVQVFTGVPHRELKGFMEDSAVDLVVMATHGHTGIAHMLLGSVAEKILRTAPCPVLTVRPAEKGTE